MARRTLVQRLHNPRDRECTCDADCWCNRTAVGRAVKWWFPAGWFGIDHKLPVADGLTLPERQERKRQQER